MRAAMGAIGSDWRFRLGLAAAVGLVAGGCALATSASSGRRDRSTDVEDVVDRYMHRFDSVAVDDVISRADSEFSVVTGPDRRPGPGEVWTETTHSIGRLAAVEQARDGVLTRAELRDVVAGYAADGERLTRSELDRFVSRYGETHVENDRYWVVVHTGSSLEGNYGEVRERGSRTHSTPRLP